MKVQIEVPDPDKSIRVGDVRKMFGLDGNWKAVFTVDGQVYGFPSDKRRPREGEDLMFVATERKGL